MDPSVLSDAPASEEAPRDLTSIIIGSDTELRTLLRGLLRLRRFHIVGEAESGPAAEELVGRLRPTLLVVDSGLAVDRAIEIVRWTRAQVPSTRIVLIGAGNVPLSADPRGLPHATISRPFRIREFELAVDPDHPG